VTRLVLVRHGESNATVARRLGGMRSCTGLSALGVRQADALRDRLASTKELGDVGALWSSDMPRAMQTAELIAPALGGHPVEIDQAFREHEPGDADGMTFSEVVERYGNVDWASDPYRRFIPGSETVAEFHHRVMQGLARLVESHRDDTVVLVCHGGVIDIALRGLLNLPMVGGFHTFTKNTTLTELVLMGSQWRFVRYNDGAHLDGLPDETAPAQPPAPHGAVELRPLDQSNLADVLALRPRPFQQRYVSTVSDALIESTATSGAWIRVATVDDTAVGLVVVDRDASPVRLWKLLVDARYQGHGFGAATVRAVIEALVLREMSVRWLDGPDGESPAGFWQRLGFDETGESDDGLTVGVWRAP
jgi:2,3-bisphosphoglycerate-dependent phosphoglycerate mutase